jgi:protein O-mannosyl-transferase
VYVERGLLAKAYACLKEAHKLAPSEDYIVKHLQIVETRLAKLKAQPSSTREKDLAFADFDPREFGGRALRQNKDLNYKSLKTSQVDGDKPKIMQSSKDPDILLDSHSTDNFQKHDNLQRITQNNYATDLDDPSSGMS